MLVERLRLAIIGVVYDGPRVAHLPDGLVLIGRGRKIPACPQKRQRVTGYSLVTLYAGTSARWRRGNRCLPV